MDQGTTEWKMARLGKVGASRMGDLMAKTKSGYGASRANLMADLIAERMTGVPNEGYVNTAMQWGIDHEEEARTAYEFFRDAQVEKTGFATHPVIKDSGASPDGLIGEDGLLELKCPNTATHIDTFLNGKPDGKYILQMQWQMACTNRKWCDFASYDPRMPQHLRLYVERINRDDGKILEMTDEVVVFLNELEAKIKKLEELNR